MEFAKCNIPAAAITREAAYSSEMISQLVFGEKCRVLGDGNKKWWHIRCKYDGYEGYVIKSQLTEIAEPAFEAPDTFFTRDMFGWLRQSGIAVPLPAGAWLDSSNRNSYDGAVMETAGVTAPMDALVTLAQAFLYCPYLWGGKTSFGLDCSGFTQTVYRLCGRHLPRDAWQQAEKGADVGFLQEVLPGDLAFFDDAEGRIIHVGIMLRPHAIIHAAGRVRTDKIDHLGIINSDTGERTHKLRVVRRYI